MHQNVRREQYYAMQQTIHRPGSPLGGPQQGGPRSQSIIITAITLFALSGLLVGFTFGALTIKKHPSVATTSTQTNKQSNPITIPQVATPTPILSEQIVPLGFPKISTLSTETQIADGTTSYTLSAYPTDKTGNQVHSANITCKIWLTKNQDVTKVLLKHATDRLDQVDTLTQPMPNEEENALVFSGTTQQTQKCNASGNTTWTYTVAPSADAGNYLLVVLTDWSGQHWNWFTAQIQITKQNQ